MVPPFFRAAARRENVDHDFLEKVSGHGFVATELHRASVRRTDIGHSQVLSLGAAGNGKKRCSSLSRRQQGLSSLEAGLRANITTSLIKETEAQVEARLLQWGGCTAEYFKAKTNEVKELLIVLTRTAESMGEQDQRYASEFGNFTTRLQAIADLEDISQIRSSLVQRAHELRTYVDQMKQESQKSVAQLQAEVTTSRVTTCCSNSRRSSSRTPVPPTSSAAGEEMSLS